MYRVIAHKSYRRKRAIQEAMGVLSKVFKTMIFVKKFEKFSGDHFVALNLQTVVSVLPSFQTGCSGMLQLFISLLSSNCLDLDLDFEIIVLNAYLSSFVLDLVTLCEICLGTTEESLKYTRVRSL